MDSDGGYASENARLIDEEIFYFVDDKTLRFLENELSKIILSEI